jgi:DNA-binding MarR family transcriptional regulator
MTSIWQYMAYDAVEILLAETLVLANQYRHSFAELHRTGSVHASSWQVIQILANGPRTVPQIARQRCTSRQNIQSLVNGLASEGLVELVNNPDHQRSSLVRLTLQGKESVAGAKGTEMTLLAWLNSQVLEADLVSATKLLRRIRELLVEKEARNPQDKPIKRAKTTQAAQLPALATDNNELPYNLL